MLRVHSLTLVLLNDLILLKFLWYLTINIIQAELERGGNASIWTGVMASVRHENSNVWFHRSILSLND